MCSYRGSRILPILPLQAQLFAVAIIVVVAVAVAVSFIVEWIWGRRIVKFGEHVQADGEKGGLRKLLGSADVSVGPKGSDREGDGVCDGG